MATVEMRWDGLDTFHLLLPGNHGLTVLAPTAKSISELQLMVHKAGFLHTIWLGVCRVAFQVLQSLLYPSDLFLVDFYFK